MDIRCMFYRTPGKSTTLLDPQCPSRVKGFNKAFRMSIKIEEVLKVVNAANGHKEKKCSFKVKRL